MDALRFYVPETYAEYAKDRIKSICELNDCTITENLKEADVVFATHFKDKVIERKANVDVEKSKKLYKSVNHSKQYINWIYGLECLDSKKCNFLLMKSLYEKHGCSIHTDSLEIIPKQFDLTNKEQCKLFQNEPIKNYYLAKGAESQSGEDIYVIKTNNVDCDKGKIKVENKLYDIENKKFQAQRLVIPLLLDGKVSTFRIYTLILYTKKHGFICYYYHPGYAYSSVKKFKKGDYSIESIVANKGDIQGWEADQIDEELIKQKKIKKGESFMKSLSKNSFSQKVKFIVDIVMKSVLPKFKREEKVFALLGCDVLVDSDLNCFWIDPNITARFGAWAQPQWESAIKLVKGINENKITPKVNKIEKIKQSTFTFNGSTVYGTGDWMCVFCENKSDLKIKCTRKSKKPISKTIGTRKRRL